MPAELEVRLRILLTNDDGIDAPGLLALRSALEDRHEVWVVAPESNRSGSSHCVTLGEASRVRPRGARVWAATGTPVDCVIIAALALVKEPIDLVLSGINQGPNLGTDLLYSGTAGAARQAALHDVPGVALSLCRRDPPFSYDRAAAFVSANLDAFRTIWARGFYLNVNLPGGRGPYRGVKLARPSVREYHDRLETWRSPRGDLYCHLTGEAPGAVPDESSDFAAVEAGLVSVSPLAVEPGSGSLHCPSLDCLVWDV